MNRPSRRAGQRQLRLAEIHWCPGTRRRRVAISLPPSQYESMSATNPKVDGYVRKNKKWADQLPKLRRIVLDCGLTEELKWRFPVYTFQNANVVILWGFKEHCAIGFFKGALLKDPKRILIKPGENSQSMRQIRFTSVQEIDKIESILKAYIREAIEVEKSGLKVKLKKITDRAIPDELQNKFKKNPALKSAFGALTPGRQRAYLLHFSSAKQPKTREARIDKCVPQILNGKGLGD
jgi:uncharacterized protein YdeI (YjbR/CyaY-like superfamily)